MEFKRDPDAWITRKRLPMYLSMTVGQGGLNGGAPSSRRSLAAPPWIIILICSGLPLAWLSLQLLSHPNVLASAWPDRFRRELLTRTLAYNALAAIIATL